MYGFSIMRLLASSTMASRGRTPMTKAKLQHRVWEFFSQLVLRGNLTLLWNTPFMESLVSWLVELTKAPAENIR